MGNSATNSLNGDKGNTNRGTKLTPHEMVTGRRMPRGDRETTEIEDVDKSKSELDKYVPSIFQTEFRPREIRYPALKLSMPPNVVSYKNNYTCYERIEGSIYRKIFGPGWCSRTIKENETYW